MNGLRDGTWEIRAKVFCSGYDSFAAAGVKYSSTEDNLNLIVDVNQPLAVDASILNDVFKVDFSEPLACPQLAPSQMPYQIRHVKTCDGATIESHVGSFSAEAVINTFSGVCLNGDGQGSPLQVSNVVRKLRAHRKSFLVQSENERGTQKATADVNGNPVATAKYTATFGCKGPCLVIENSHFDVHSWITPRKQHERKEETKHKRYRRIQKRRARREHENDHHDENYHTSVWFLRDCSPHRLGCFRRRVSFRAKRRRRKKERDDASFRTLSKSFVERRGRRTSRTVVN